MAGYLIKDTTRAEREQIVAESLGNIEATCDGCMSGLAEMYQEYIEGKKELREINMEFNARYVKGEDMPGAAAVRCRNWYETSIDGLSNEVSEFGLENDKRLAFKWRWKSCGI